jgi:LuxR family maltose regulon positive regulatory protein
MEASLRHPLTLLQAPAGYGKSRLLRDWRQHAASMGRTASLLIRPDAAALRAALARSAAPATLLIDELGPEAETVLMAWLASPSDSLRLVLAARGLGGLRLGRLRAMGMLLEIVPEEIRLDEDEARDAFRALSGRDPGPAEAADLLTRNQGWPLAIVLQARAARDGKAPAPNGEGRLLFDYFREEVLDGLAEETRAFLLHIAVPGRICAPLCDALTGEAGSQARLEALLREGLFLRPLDEERRWFRFHPLFLEFLRRLLKDEQPALANRLARRAAAWFHAQGLDLEAGQHALHSGDARRAYRLLEQVCRDVSGSSHGITDLVTPEATRRLLAFPDLVLSICWVLCNRWQFRLVEELLTLLEPRIAAMERGTGAERQEAARLHRLVRHRRMMQALFEDRPALAAERAGELLPELALLHPYIRASVHSTLLHAERDGFRMGALAARDVAARRECDQTDRIQGLIWHSTVAGSAHFAAGEVEGARRALAEGATLARQEEDLPWLAAIPAVLLAEIHLERNEVAEAQALIKGALPALRHGMVEHLVAGHATAARLHRIAGREEEALSVLEGAMRLSARHDFPRLRWAMAALRLRFLAEDGAVGPGLRVARDLGLAPAGEPPLPRRGTAGTAEWHALAWVRAAMLAARPDAALGVASRWFDFTGSAGAIRSAVRWGALSARLEAAQGEGRAAQRRLRRALLLAAPAGLARPFLDEGEVVLGLIRQQAGTGPAGGTEVDGFLATILGSPGRESPAGDTGAGFAGGLSSTEAEVARLAGAGLRNREIGERLGLTEGTVKWYLQRIYDKTGVRRRASVAERARAAGLMG